MHTHARVLRLRQPTWVLLSRSYAAIESHYVNESNESGHDQPLHKKVERAISNEEVGFIKHDLTNVQIQYNVKNCDCMV